MKWFGIRAAGSTNIEGAVFYDPTPTYASVTVENVRFVMWLNADADVEVAPGMWSSDDGVTWDPDDLGVLGVYDTITGASWISSPNRTFVEGVHACPRTSRRRRTVRPGWR